MNCLFNRLKTPALNLRLCRSVAGLFLLCALSTSCGLVPKRSSVTDPSKPVIIQASNTQAQTQYDQGVELLQKGDYQSSQKVLARVATSYPDDDIAPISSLYAARAAMGKLNINSDGTWSSGVGNAKAGQRASAFTSIAKKSSDQVRYAAQLYASVAYAFAGRRDAAMALLKDYPSANVNSLVLEPDRVLALYTLSAALSTHKRHKDALVASANLFHARRAQIQADASMVADDDWILSYALSTAFETASTRLPEKSLHMEFLTSKDDVLRASAGRALLGRIASKPVTPQSRAMAEDLFTRTSDALMNLGLEREVAQLSQVMASLQDEQRMVLGAILPLSGKRAPVGARAMRGVLLAQRAFESPEGASSEVTVVFVDAAGEPAAVLAQLKALGAVAAIGPLDNARAALFGAQAQKEKFPLMMLSTSAPTAPAAQSAYVFRHFIDARAETDIMAKVVHTKLPKGRVVVLAPDIAYGKRMADGFTQALGSKHPPVLRINYARKSNDYRTLAQKVARARPDAIFIPDTSDKVSQVSAFLAKENIWGVSITRPKPTRSKRRLVHYLGTSLWQNAQLIAQARTYVQGALMPSWYAASTRTPSSQAFTASYATVYATQPSVYAAFAYDATTWFGALMQGDGLRSSGALAKALTRAQGFDGVTGQVRFTPKGDAVRSVRLVEVSAGKFAPVTLKLTGDEAKP